MEKKAPFILRLLKGIGFFLLGIILLIILWFAFCFFNKKQSIQALPSDYSVYIRTDSAWDAVEPLLDLKAADILLADPGFIQFRELFITLRETDIRKNKIVSMAASRRIDAGLYADNNFLAIADMGILSGATRLAPFAMNFITVPNLSYHKNGKASFFEYNAGTQVIYIKIYKNLVVATTSKELLDQAFTFENHLKYSPTELTLLEEPLKQPIRILANPQLLFEQYTKENEYIKAVSSVLSTESLSSISFGITDENINISIKVPFEISQELKDSDNAIINLLKKDSEVPGMLAKLPESVQYYTFMTVGSLEELKDAAFTALASKKDLPKLYQTADNLCQMMFRSSIDDLFFSWTDDEYAILGLEDKDDPVFVLKVKDEAKRQEVFESLLSSIILKSDNSLLLDGIRLPRIELPSFIHNLLEGFGINLPKPYYMVKDGYIYFSQSPEDLASINAALKNGAKLTSNQNWKSITTNQNSQTSLSLYYNLERSIPFFIKSNNLISKVLQLYNIGKLDVSTKKDNLYFQLNAISVDNPSTKKIAGFPIELQSKVTPALYKSNLDKSKLVFWQEKEEIKAINTANFSIISKEIDNLSWIAPCLAGDKGNAEVWALTKDGTVYLLDGKLEILDGFPELTGQTPAAQPSVIGQEIIFPNSDGNLIAVNNKGAERIIECDVMGNIKAAVTIDGNSLAFYEKGFLGCIHLIYDISNPESQIEIPVDGIAYGSPALMREKNKLYIAFITQAGNLNIWETDGTSYSLIENYPVNIDGIFYNNLTTIDNNFYALSQTGDLFKINLAGGITLVKIPNLTGKSSWITGFDYNKDKEQEIFVCGDGNILYGFTKELEFLNNFPVAGYGQPAFADCNGDKKNDCLVLTIDNKLNAWKIQ